MRSTFIFDLSTINDGNCFLLYFLLKFESKVAIDFTFQQQIQVTVIIYEILSSLIVSFLCWTSDRVMEDWKLNSLAVVKLERQVDVESRQAPVEEPLCPPLNDTLNLFIMKILNQLHFGFRFHEFQHDNHIILTFPEVSETNLKRIYCISMYNMTPQGVPIINHSICKKVVEKLLVCNIFK